MVNESKKQALKGLLEFVERMTDQAYQERVWRKGEGPERDHFLKNYKNFGTSDEQYNLLKKFHDVLDVFSDEMLYLPAQTIISDPRWKNIREMAEEALKAFHYEKRQKM